MNIFTAYEITSPIYISSAADKEDVAKEIAKKVADYVMEYWPLASIEQIEEALDAAKRCVELGADLNGAIDCACRVMRSDT